MTELSNQLQALRLADADVASIMDAYDEIDRVYNAALVAMGVRAENTEAVVNSADITLSRQSVDSTQFLTIQQ